MIEQDPLSSLFSGLGSGIQGLMGGLQRLTTGTGQFDLNQAFGPTNMLAPTPDDFYSLLAQVQKTGLLDNTSDSYLNNFAEIVKQANRNPGDAGLVQRAAQIQQSLQSMLDQRTQYNQRVGVGNDFVNQVSDFTNNNPNLKQLSDLISQHLSTPLYDAKTIEGNVDQAKDARSMSGTSIMNQANEGLAARGLSGSGISADLLTQAKERTAQDLTNIDTNLRTQYKTANDADQLQWSNIANNLGQFKTNLLSGAANTLLGIKENGIPQFDTSSIFNQLGQLGQQVAGTGLYNQQLNAQATQQNQQNQQQQFQDLLGLVSLFHQPGGGGGNGGSRSSFSTGVSLGIPIGM